jgi:hypothetical protein
MTNRVPFFGKEEKITSMRPKTRMVNFLGSWPLIFLEASN